MKKREKKRFFLLAAAFCILAAQLPAGAQATEETEMTAQFRENGLGIPDGEYRTDGFSWSGGSGRVEITCEKVKILNEKAFAELTFSSTSYEYIKVDGIKYYGEKDERTTTFSIPAVLNRNMEIIGLTTKMSSPHEITYTIYIELEHGSASDGHERKDEKNAASAPRVTGLTAKSEEAILSAEFFNLFLYEGDIYLLETDEDTSCPDYLIVPEETEIPAGLEKEMTIIRQPAEHVFVCSEKVLLFASEHADAAARIAAVGTEESVEVPGGFALSETMVSAGTWMDPDFRSLIEAGCDLVILPAQSLSEDIEEIKENFATLNIPVLIEHSENETSETGKKAWETVFGILFGISEEGKEP